MPRIKLHKALSEESLAVFRQLAALRLPLSAAAAILTEQSGVEVSESNLRWHISHNRLIKRIYELGRARAALSLAQNAYALATDGGTVSGLQYYERSRGLLSDLPAQDGNSTANQVLDDPLPIVLIPDNHRHDCSLPLTSEAKLEKLLGDDLDED